MLKKMHISELPKRTRFQPASFESLPEWPKFKAELDAGLGEGEALDLFISEEKAEKYSLQHRKTGFRFLKKYIKTIGKKYHLSTVKGSGGTHYQVSNPVVIVTKRKRA